MTKLLVGMVALVFAVGVSACGNSEKTRAKAPIAQAEAVATPRTADVKLAGGSEPSKVSGSQPNVLETGPSP